jgi:FKBP-type peptidyl-prolyl cis-trans isomerase FklB
LVAVCRAEEKVPLTDKKAKNSYSLGYEFGSNLRAQEVEIDEDILVTAIHEALKGSEPTMKLQDIRDTLKQLRKEVLIRYNLRRNELVAKNKKDGEAFLAANKEKPGVTTLPSGLQYKVLHEGSGPRPQANDEVLVRYRGTLVDGTEFDSSYSRKEPARIRVDGAIRGWTEALQLMKVGSKWQIFVPAELGYGKRQSSRIPPESALVFEIELKGIEKKTATGSETGKAEKE